MDNYDKNFNAALNGYPPPDPFSQGAIDGATMRRTIQGTQSETPPLNLDPETAKNVGMLKIGGYIGAAIAITGGIVIEKNHKTAMDVFHTIISTPFDNIDYILAAGTGWVASKALTSRVISKNTLASFCIAAAAATASVYATKIYVRDNTKVEIDPTHMSPWSLTYAMRDNIRTNYYKAGQELVAQLTQMARRTANEVIVNPLLFPEHQQNNNVCSNTTNTCENGDKRIEFVDEKKLGMYGYAHSGSFHPTATDYAQVTEYRYTQKSNPAGQLTFKISTSYGLTPILYFGGSELQYKNIPTSVNDFSYPYGLLYMAMYRLKMPLFKISMSTNISITSNGKFEPSITTVLRDNQTGRPEITTCLDNPRQVGSVIYHTVISGDALKTFSTNTDLGRMLKILGNSQRYIRNQDHKDGISCFRPNGYDSYLSIGLQRLEN